MAANRRLCSVSALTGALLLCSTLPVLGQIEPRPSDTAVIVDGRVQNVFRAEGEYLVQILVQRCDVPRLDEKTGGTRFPIPGEYVYVHVEQPVARRAGLTALLPEPQMYIRAFLRIGERHRWEGGTAGWFEQTSSGPADVPRRREPGSERLGVTTELAFYGGEAAVKVTNVEPDSPAQRAGIRPGLLILKANGDQIVRPDRLAEAERGARGTLRLQVVDPRDRRERLIEVDLR